MNIKLASWLRSSLVAVALLLTIGAPCASAAVAFDAAPTSSGFNFSGVVTRATGSFTVGSGANRACMVMLAMAANTATAITATCGGKTANLVSGTDSGTTTTLRTMIFCAIAPNSGAQTASASWTTSMDADIGAFTVTGADQTTPCNHGTFTAATNAPANPTSLSVTSTSGDLTGAIGYTLDSWTAENQTVTWGPDSSVCVGTRGPGTGTTAHTFTDSFSGQTVSVSGANLAAAAGGATPCAHGMLGVFSCDEASR